VRVDGIDLTGFSKNSVWLWSHDYHGARPPIGTVISTNRETDPVLGRIFTYRVIPIGVDDVGRLADALLAGTFVQHLATNGR
jgi:hypothetical protein